MKAKASAPLMFCIAMAIAGCGGGGAGSSTPGGGAAQLTFNAKATPAGSVLAQGDPSKMRIIWFDSSQKQDFFTIYVRAPFTTGTPIALGLPGSRAYAFTRGDYGLYSTPATGAGSITLTGAGGSVSGSFTLNMFNVRGNLISASGTFTNVAVAGFGGGTVSK